MHGRPACSPGCCRLPGCSRQAACQPGIPARQAGFLVSWHTASSAGYIACSHPSVLAHGLTTLSCCGDSSKEPKGYCNWHELHAVSQDSSPAKILAVNAPCMDLQSKLHASGLEPCFEPIACSEFWASGAHLQGTLSFAKARVDEVAIWGTCDNAIGQVAQHSISS